MNRLPDDFETGDFQGIIDLMSRAGWVKRALETPTGINVEWTELGFAKAKEMALAISPLTKWMQDRSQPKPDLAAQVQCVLQLNPYLQEIGWNGNDLMENFKVVAFIGYLAPQP